MISSEAASLFSQIKNNNSSGAPPNSLEERRDLANRFSDIPNNSLVSITDEHIANIRTVKVSAGNRKSKTSLILVHGGAFALMSPETHRDLAIKLATICNTDVYVPDYSLAPEAPFPSALIEIESVICEVIANEQSMDRQVAVVGESAGGALVLSAVVNMRDRNQHLPAAIILLCPWLDLSLSGDSIARNQDNDIILSEADLRYFVELYVGDSAYSSADPQVSPLFAQLHGLPPIYCQAAANDLLMDDSIRLKSTVMSHSQGSIKLDLFDDMCHSFQFFAGRLPEADYAIVKVAHFLKENGS